VPDTPTGTRAGWSRKPRTKRAVSAAPVLGSHISYQADADRARPRAHRHERGALVQKRHGPVVRSHGPVPWPTCPKPGRFRDCSLNLSQRHGLPEPSAAACSPGCPARRLARTERHGAHSVQYHGVRLAHERS
jgi:hypothetical protein